MYRKLSFTISVILSVLCFIGLAVKSQHPSSSSVFNGRSDRIVEDMPIVYDPTYKGYGSGYAPIEQRGPEFVKWLQAGVKISVSGASGSGTIIYYDETENWAYIQSCGHLWNGTMSAQEGKNRKITCKIITWYHNDQKLGSTKEYPAEVLYYSNVRGKDCSLLRFQPDWKPKYFPLAPDNYEFVENGHYHSIGCDGGKEVAHYDVRFVALRGADVVTTDNSPRPGRSGGGLISPDEYYVAICWGTSDRSGSGIGYFTPIKTIREHNQQNGYGWLNEVGKNLARKIPIIDRNNPQGTYPPDYIPLPFR